MGIEEKIRNSFMNLKADISSLKEEITELRERVDAIDKGNTNVSDKIFTSKPFVNQEMRNAVNEVFDSRMFATGKKTDEFEKKFASFVGSKHAIAVNNGTVAIELAMLALDIGEGDEVIVPSHTTMPSVEPILHVGAKPVFVDIGEDYLIDVSKIEKVITKKTRAIMPVHLYGNVADVTSIKKLCDKYGLFFIEDCAQAHNARVKGKHVGSFGDIGCFSFYPTKNLTVCGEGGMVVTNNAQLAKKIRMLRSHGEDGRYNHVILGGNYRLSEIHSAIGVKQLELLEYFTRRRQEIAKIYDAHLTKVKKPVVRSDVNHSYHLYVIRVNAKKREKLMKMLQKEGIFLGIHYPIPCHKQKVVKEMLTKSFSLPHTEKVVKEIVSLPIYPELTDEQAIRVAQRINKLA